MSTPEHETHPSFGVAVVTRSSGTGRALFQSDLLHNETITLSIHEADRKRDLNSDWVHPGREIIEVEMSLAQWGAVVSSIGIGSGVPVTIRRRGGPRVAEPPFEPRVKENLTEVNGTIDRLLERVRDTYATLEEAIDNKRGAKAIREARQSHRWALEQVNGNAKYAVDSLSRAAEKVVSAARADIESSILNAARLTGASPIEAPEMPTLEVEQ